MQGTKTEFSDGLSQILGASGNIYMYMWHNTIQSKLYIDTHGHCKL